MVARLTPLAEKGSGLNGTKLSNLDGARSLSSGRIQIDERRCLAGSVVFEKCMKCNGIRF